MSEESRPVCPNQSTPFLFTDDLSSRSRYIMKARCKLWSCPYCGKVNAHQHYIRILNGINELRNTGIELSFVTVTSHERLRTTDECLYVWRKAWRVLRERYRRLYEKSAEYPLAFSIVTEFHKDKRLHWHIIISGYAPSRWWKDNARQVGLGYQSKSVKLNNAAQGANYLTKYLRKSLSETDYPKKMRRIVYSQTFPDKPHPDVTYEWEVLDPKTSIVECIESGWKLDLSTFLEWNEITEILAR